MRLRVPLVLGKTEPTTSTVTSRAPSMHPRAFFEAYVLPTQKEWSTNSGNIRRAVFALCQLDILAEHVIIHLNPGIKPDAVSAERIGGAIGAGPIGAAPIGGTLDTVTLLLDDGTQIDAAAVITTCRRFWERELGRLGL
jgi:hypothetical protein